ncbi:hypothetical protein D9M71_386310 [compost metagenome]
MHADHALWVSEFGGQAGDRQRGGVAGQDAVGAAQAFQLAEQVALDLQVLDDGFDHQARIGQLGDGVGRLQVGHAGRIGSGGQLAALDALGQLPVDAGNGLASGARAFVVELDRVPGLGCDLGNAGAHGTGADHGDNGVAVECWHGLSAP